MPTYSYTTHATSQPIHVTADNLPAAIRRLLEQDVGVTSIGEPARDPAGDAHLSEADLCIFLRQMAAMLENGTPVVEALRLLAEEARTGGMRRVLSAVAADVAEGIPLSAAISARPRAFGPLTAALVRAGETSGALEETLREAAEQREGFAEALRGALALLLYPCLVACLGFFVVTILLLVIIPKWVQLYHELGIEQLPFLTRLIVLLSRGLPWFLLALIISGVTALVLVLLRRRSARGRLVLDYWRLGTPILGRLNLYLALARVTQALSLLLRRGVPMVEALRLAGAAAGNSVIGAAFRRGERAVAEGQPVADGLRDVKALPESFIWRLSVAERSGEVADTLAGMSRYYSEAARLRARAARGVMEPILIILLGLLVLAIVLGIFAPLITIVSQLSGI